MHKISIIVVCLNPGQKLIDTMESILNQSFDDYEVVVKDGFSKDGSIDDLKVWLETTGANIKNKVQVHQLQDKSIYEAMNQAVRLANGEFLYFLNCGDYFYSSESLLEAVAEMGKHPEGKIFYGNVYDVIRESVVQSNPNIDAFACYRHVPCHQACIYHKELFEDRGYKPEYRVRADYEHFLWCYFEKDVKPQYIPVVLANYEGGGFSETKENRRRSLNEHKEIVATYMSKGQLMKYKVIMFLSLQPVRTWLAESKVFGGFYQTIKKWLYKR